MRPTTTCERLGLILDEWDESSDHARTSGKLRALERDLLDTDPPREFRTANGGEPGWKDWHELVARHLAAADLARALEGDLERSRADVANARDGERIALADAAQWKDTYTRASTDYNTALNTALDDLRAERHKLGERIVELEDQNDALVRRLRGKDVDAHVAAVYEKTHVVPTMSFAHYRALEKPTPCPLGLCGRKLPQPSSGHFCLHGNACGYELVLGEPHSTPACPHCANELADFQKWREVNGENFRRGLPTEPPEAST